MQSERRACQNPAIQRAVWALVDTPRNHLLIFFFPPPTPQEDCRLALRFCGNVFVLDTKAVYVLLPVSSLFFFSLNGHIVAHLPILGSHHPWKRTSCDQNRGQ